MRVDWIGLSPTAAVFQRFVEAVLLKRRRMNGVPVHDESAALDFPIAAAPFIAVNVAPAGHHVVAARRHLRDHVKLADRAVAAAKRAFDSFSRTSLDDRLALIERILAIYRTRIDDIAHVLPREMGATTAVARGQAEGGAAHIARTIIATRRASPPSCARPATATPASCRSAHPAASPLAGSAGAAARRPSCGEGAVNAMVWE